MKETRYKPTRDEKCSAISSGMVARRCPNLALYGIQYHGQHEFDQGPTWVVAWLCKKHVAERDGK